MSSSTTTVMFRSAAVLVALAMLVVAAGSPASTARAVNPACTNDSQHWYGQAISGAGSTLGTGSYTNVWTSYSVNANGFNFSDEAVWIINDNDLYNALEAGFYSGSGSTIAWTNAVLPYYTIGNGYSETNINAPLTLGSLIWMGVQTSPSFMSVGPTSMYINSGSYSVSSPRRNFSQGETGSSNGSLNWMGGGSGESFTNYWLDQSTNNWYQWSYNNVCANGPYWATSNSASSWSNGGY